jgi:hypothetical protein
LDVVIAAALSRASFAECVTYPWDQMLDGKMRNTLYLNLGGGRFRDVTVASGILNNRGFKDTAGPRPDLDGQPSPTWATAMVDYDLDGKIDILFAGDQCTLLPTVFSGLIQVFKGNGSGGFVNVTPEVGTDAIGGWMGLAFGDFDHNGVMDIFATNMGDYVGTGKFTAGVGQTYRLGDMASRAFLGHRNSSGDVVYERAPIDDVGASSWGWGVSAFDYDNDGHTDVVYNCGGDITFTVDASNPGSFLHNLGNGRFAYDRQAVKKSHSRRNVYGLAVGDLNNDGFGDIVSVSSVNIAPSVTLQFYPTGWGVPSDAYAQFAERLNPDPTTPSLWHYSPVELDDGTLAIEINSAHNGNRQIAVSLVGTVGILPNGRVNRDGVGAVVFSTPRGGQTVMSPVLAGSSAFSQHSLVQGFGLGKASSATIEVLWPSGIRNRLNDVAAGELVRFPEIPCDVDADWSQAVAGANPRDAYSGCVGDALDKLTQAGLIDMTAKRRFISSALAVYNEKHGQ